MAQNNLKDESSKLHLFRIHYEESYSNKIFGNIIYTIVNRKEASNLIVK